MNEVSPLLSHKDHINELGLARLAELVERVPQDFTLDVEASPRCLTMRLRFERDQPVYALAESANALCHAAMCLDTLVKNLQAERQHRAAMVPWPAP